ncbi:MAG: hypothetical protein ACFFFC_01800 [Candidatus Thorarchaeota archaeon]
MTNKDSYSIVFGGTSTVLMYKREQLHLMYSFESIEITGYDGKQIPNTYLKLKGFGDKIALVFPGRGYTSQGPLLHYTISLLLENRVSVLSVDYAYWNNQDFNSLEWEDRQRWLYSDVEEAYKAAIDQIDAEVRVLVGKSLGTLAIGHLLDTFSETRNCKVIWHTPLIKMPHLVMQITKYHPNSIFIIGTSDSHYDKDILNQVKSATAGNLVVVDDANHSMEVPGGVSDSLGVMNEIIEGIRQFMWPVDK